MEQEFYYLLVQLAENITEKDFKNMKFYSGGFISKGRMEKIKDSLDLFNELESRLFMSFDNVEPLRLMVEKCTNNNRKLIEMIIRFQKRSGGEANTNVNEGADKNLSTDRTQDFREELSLFLNELGKDWKFFIRDLRVPEPELEIQLKQNPYDLKEAIYGCLKYWLTNLADQKTDEEIRKEWIRSLESIERNDLVSKLELL